MEFIRENRSAFYGLAVLILIPILLPDPYIIHIFILALLFGTLAMSWDLAWGYAGIFTLGHAASFGVGAYVSALLSMRIGISPWITMFIGGASSAFFGLIIGAPCLRLRGAPYIAIATLGLSEVIRITCCNLVEITRGELGLWGIPPFPDLGPIAFRGGVRTPYYYLILTIFFISYIWLKCIVNSKLGLGFKAIAASEDAAMAIGVNISRVKLLAFAISNFIAGLCGAFYAHYILILTPAIMGVTYMTDIITMTLLGGVGTLVGPIIGSFLVTLSLEYLRVYGLARFLLYGLILIVVVIFMPEGVIIRGVKALGKLKRSIKSWA
jgi:branched-chain amino acid transport system permease protein